MSKKTDVNIANLPRTIKDKLSEFRKMLKANGLFQYQDKIIELAPNSLKNVYVFTTFCGGALTSLSHYILQNHLFLVIFHVRIDLFLFHRVFKVIFLQILLLVLFLVLMLLFEIIRSFPHDSTKWLYISDAVNFSKTTRTYLTTNYNSPTKLKDRISFETKALGIDL